MSNQITAGNAKAIAFHVRQGEAFGGLSKEAFAVWLESVAAAFEPVKPVLPTIHLNGTSADMLLQGYQAAMEATQTAREALAAIEFNARDYYPQGDKAWAQADANRRELHIKLAAVFEELQEHALECANAIHEKEERMRARTLSTIIAAGKGAQ